jgi:hypothetical protein
VPPTPASIERLIELTQGRRSYESMAAQIRPYEERRILPSAEAAHHLTPAQRATLNAQAEKLFAEAQASYSWEKIKPIYIKVYSSHFSQQDADNIIAFYESPTGRAFVASLTSSVQTSASLLRQQLFQILQKTNGQIQTMAAQLAPPPPPPAPVPPKPVPTAPPAGHSP